MEVYGRFTKGEMEEESLPAGGETERKPHPSNHENREKEHRALLLSSALSSLGAW